MALQCQCPGTAPTQPPAPLPSPRACQFPTSSGSQLPPRGMGLGGHQVSRRYKTEGLVAAWGCGPCLVTGRPSGASDCSQRQNNARRAARAPRATPQHTARKPPPLPWQDQTCAGVPNPLMPPGLNLLSGVGGCAGRSGLVAQHGIALSELQTPAPSSSTLVPPHMAHPAAAMGRRGWEGSRSDGECQALEHRPGHWDQPPPREDLNSCLCPERQPLLCLLCAMRLLPLLLLLALCFLWARMVSSGEHGVGTTWAWGRHRSAAGRCHGRICSRHQQTSPAAPPDGLQRLSGALGHCCRADDCSQVLAAGLGPGSFHLSSGFS